MKTTLAMLVAGISCMLLFPACHKDTTTPIPTQPYGKKKIARFGDVQFSYDSQGRLSKIYYPGQSETDTYGYGNGTVHSAWAVGTTRLLVWDCTLNANGFITQQTLKDEDGSGNINATYQYNFTYSNSNILTGEYSAGGNQYHWDYIYTNDLITEKRSYTNGKLVYITRLTYYTDKPQRTIINEIYPDLGYFTLLHGEPQPFMMKTWDGYSVDSNGVEKHESSYLYEYDLDSDGYVTKHTQKNLMKGTEEVNTVEYE